MCSLLLIELHAFDIQWDRIKIVNTTNAPGLSLLSSAVSSSQYKVSPLQ